METDDDQVYVGGMMDLDNAVMVQIVVRTYPMPDHMMFDDEKPIKFVSLHELDDDFDIAIYIPDYLPEITPDHILFEGIESLMYVVGKAYLENGPEAIATL